MGLLNRLHQLDELANERWLGISTTEWHQVHFEDRPDFRGYGPTSYRDWRVIRDHIDNIGPQGAFIDYGAGLGRITVLAARLPFKQVVGVDIDPDLVERGKYNIGRARGLKCRAHIVCCDAALFDLPPDTSIVYFRNPFSGKVLAAVLENVRKLQRDVHIICNLPIPSAFENEIRQSRWLAIQDEFLLSGDRKGLIFATI